MDINFDTNSNISIRELDVKNNKIVKVGFLKSFERAIIKFVTLISAKLTNNYWNSLEKKINEAVMQYFDDAGKGVADQGENLAGYINKIDNVKLFFGNKLSEKNKASINQKFNDVIVKVEGILESEKDLLFSGYTEKLGEISAQFKSGLELIYNNKLSFLISEFRNLSDIINDKTAKQIDAARNYQSNQLAKLSKEIKSLTEKSITVRAKIEQLHNLNKKL